MTTIAKTPPTEIETLREQLYDALDTYIQTEDVGLPAHTAAKQLITGELRLLQEIHRALYLLRSRLIIGRSSCSCGSVEGEMHAGNCTRQGVVDRITVAPVSEPVEIRGDRADEHCELAPQGCIYLALPGTKRCAQHPVPGPQED